MTNEIRTTARRRRARRRAIASLSDFPAAPRVDAGFRYCWGCRSPLAETAFIGRREICRDCSDYGATPAVAIAADESPDALMLRYSETGDESALARLQELTVARLKRLILFRKVRPADADDVLQAVWLTVSNARGNYHPDGSALGWLRRIAVSRATDHQRVIARRAQAQNGTAARALHADMIETHAIRAQRDNPLWQAQYSETCAILDAKLAALPRVQREAYQFASAGWSLFDIAAQQEVSKETAKSRLRYARERMAEALEEAEAAAPENEATGFAAGCAQTLAYSGSDNPDGGQGTGMFRHLGGVWT